MIGLCTPLVLLHHGNVNRDGEKEHAVVAYGYVGGSFQVLFLFC